MKHKKCMKLLITVITAVQVVLAAIWIFANMTQVQNFGFTPSYIEAATTFHTDGYLGVGYAALLHVFGSNYTLLYFVQWILLGISLYIILALMVNNRFMRIVLTLYGITIPMVLQCAFMVMPYAIATTILFLMLRLLYEIFNKRSNPLKSNNPVLFYSFAIVLILLLGGTWTITMGKYSGWVLVGLIPYLIYCICKKKQRVLACILMIGFLTLGILSHRELGTDYADEFGRGERTIGTTLVGRVVWPRFSEAYYFWNDSLKEIMSEGRAREMDTYPEQIISEWIPDIEANYTAEPAETLYYDMATVVFKNWTKDVVKEIAVDVTAYGMAPYTVYFNLLGVQGSVTGHNVATFRQENVWLFTTYLRFFIASLFMLTLASVVQFIYLRIKKVRVCKNCSTFFWITIGMWIVITLWNVIFAIRGFDYKNVLFTILLWPIVWTLFLTKANREESE